MTPSPETFTEFGSSSIDFTWLFLKMIFAMIVVISLAILVIKFIIPKLALNRGRGGQTDFQIMDRIPLDAKKSLYVVQVEGKKLLIGASEHQLALITELGKQNPESRSQNPE